MQGASVRVEGAGLRPDPDHEDKEQLAIWAIQNHTYQPPLIPECRALGWSLRSAAKTVKEMTKGLLSVTTEIKI